MVAPDRLVILHAPGHAPDVWLTTVLEAEETDADSIGYSEAYRVADELPGRVAYQGVVGHSKVDTRAVKSPRGDAGDNPIAVRRDHEVFRAAVMKVDDPGRPTKFAPERHLTVVDYHIPGGKVCHINAHPSPLFCGLRKWRRVMREVQREVAKAKARGCYVVVTGDLQSVLLPTRMLKTAGLKVWRDRIDFIGYDKRLLLVDRKTFRPKGQDHNWMLGTFVVQA